MSEHESPEAIYEQLVSFLCSRDGNPPSSWGETEILPSSYPLPSSATGPLLQDGRSLAIRKRDLASAFLVARKIFFQAKNRSNPPSSSPRDEPPLSIEQSKVGGEDRETAVLAATSVILLFDPEHLTAANERKRVLLQRESLLLSTAPEGEEEEEEEQEEEEEEEEAASTHPSPPQTRQKNDHHHQQKRTSFQSLLHSELAFLSTLLSSPLRKHTKSPTLWYHRFWILERYHSHHLNHPNHSNHSLLPLPLPLLLPSPSISAQKMRQQQLWISEHALVLEAADRHFANYYAWDYARQVTRLLLLPRLHGVINNDDDDDDDDGDDYYYCCKGEIGGEQVKELLKTLQRYCLRHPRDASGWSYWSWLLLSLSREIKREGVDVDRAEEKREERKEKKEGVERSIVVEDAVRAVEKFREDLGWQGEVLEGFLRGF